MKQPTPRDLQKTIGPSSLGSPCDFCVANELAAPKESDLFDKQYWFGAWEGTAVHERMERLAHTYDWQGERFLTETHMRVGQIGDYGIVGGSTDLYLPDRATVIDWKSSKRDKVKLLKTAFETKLSDYDPEPLLQARFTAQKYIGQGNLYGKAWEDDGQAVERVVLVFMNRDGTGDADIWPYEFRYDRAYAEKVLDRANRVWLDIQNGRALSSFLSKIACYACASSGEPRKWSKRPI